MTEKYFWALRCLVGLMTWMMTSPLQASPEDFCWQEAADRYHIHVDLLMAIGEVESHHKPKAENKQSKARGVMQIHPWWWKKLQDEFSITPEALWQPCTNIMVGAWILHQEQQRYGAASWTAVGAYYAGAYPPTRKDEYAKHYLIYAKRVQAKLEEMKAGK